jgi:hypothetical protein
MTKFFVSAGVGALFLSAAACGSPTTEPVGPAPVSSHSSPRASALDAVLATHAGAGLAEDADGPDVKAKHGVVEVNSITFETDHEASAQAVFSGLGLQVNLGRKLGTADGCTLYANPYMTTPDTGANAGDITITTGEPETITLLPVGTGTLVSYSASAEVTYPVLKGTVSFSGAGGAGVGAFSGSAKAPAALAGFTAPTSLSRSAGWTATWTAGKSSYVAVYITAFEEGDGSISKQDILRCQTTDSGSFTVTGAALTLIPKVFKEAQAVLIRTNKETVTVGEYHVNLQANQIVESNVVALK